jgi:hypothetical protein
VAGFVQMGQKMNKWWAGARFADLSHPSHPTTESPRRPRRFGSFGDQSVEFCFEARRRGRGAPRSGSPGAKRRRLRDGGFRKAERPRHPPFTRR